jgi:hypothetical protein
MLDTGLCAKNVHAALRPTPLACSFSGHFAKMAVLGGGWPSAAQRTGGTVYPSASTVDELGPSVLALVLNR